jgi:hypothetical protein
MENRSGLVISAVVTHADGFGERRAFHIARSQRTGARSSTGD